MYNYTVIVCTENLSASKIVSIKDLRETLQQKSSDDAPAKHDSGTLTRPALGGRDASITSRGPSADSAAPRDFTMRTGSTHATPSSIVQSAASPPGKPAATAVAKSSTSSLVTRPSTAKSSTPGLVTGVPAATDGSRPSGGTLASLLQGSQAAEAKAYFTGLLPGKIPPPHVPVSAKLSVTPSFTGFTGKLGSATNSTVPPRFDFAAVSVGKISASHCS